MQRLRVTALINSYNYGRYVGEAIESVLAQNFPAEQMEILVVDDGSTDDTRQVVAGFGSRVRYLHKPNGGQASAFNCGFQHARGEIVALLDADDRWHPAKLWRVMREFDAHPEAGMVYHPFEYQDVSRNVSWKETHFPAISGIVPASRRDLLLFGSVSTSGMALRRTSLAPLLPVPESLRILADGYLGYLMIFVAPVVAVNEFLTNYRVHGENLCSFAEGTERKLRQRLDCSEQVARQVRLWLEQRFGAELPPEIGAYARRHELVTERVRFETYGATRREFYAHLRATRELYSPVWSSGYRALQRTFSLAALIFGHHGYYKLQEFYRRTAIPRIREQWMPSLSKRTLSHGSGTAS